MKAPLQTQRCKLTVITKARRPLRDQHMPVLVIIKTAAPWKSLFFSLS